MKKKDIKRRPGGSADELAAKPRHGGDVEYIRADMYAAEQAGVDVDRDEWDIRAAGTPPWMEEPEKNRGKEFSGPGRRRDPDDVSK